MPSRNFTFILLSMVTIYIAAGWGLAYFYDVTDRFSVLLYSRAVLTTTFLIAALFFSAIILKIMIVDRPRHLTRTIIDEMKGRWFTRQRMGQGLPIIIVFLFFMAAFTSLKSMIPVVHAYTWDPTLTALDRTLHLGHDPWAILQPVLGFPIITFIINIVYNMWFPVMFAILYWQAFTLKNQLMRERYFLCFFLCWIVNGTLLAMLLSSVGPCFFGELRPDLNNPYQALMVYLQNANTIYPIWSLMAQDMLWAAYVEDGLTFGSGISAMPSLHVSIAFLQMLMGYTLNRKLGHALAVFFAFIMIGSIHLGWHYAVDGYLAILTTFFIWWGIGKIRA